MSRIKFDGISKAVYYFDNIPVGCFDDGKCEILKRENMRDINKQKRF